jgi:hypothetical protein
MAAQCRQQPGREKATNRRRCRILPARNGVTRPVSDMSETMIRHNAHCGDAEAGVMLARRP